MGRQIKFRVWDSENKTLFYESNLIFLTIDGRPHFWTVDDCLIHGKIWPEYLKLQQFTGLLDKNNKEIYEGDILQYKSRDPKFSKTLVRWTREEEDNHPGFVVSDSSSHYGKPEIIGNIFENPELLK